MSTGLTARLHLKREQRVSARAERRRQAAEQVTFADLAWDHFHWEHRRLKGSADDVEAADRYRDTRAAFETRHGEIGATPCKRWWWRTRWGRSAPSSASCSA